MAGGREREDQWQSSSSLPAILSTREFYILEFEEKIKKIETCWCGGNMESRQSLHLHPGSHLFDIYVTLGFSEHRFLQL